MPLVINALRGGRTRTLICKQKQFQEPGTAAGVPGLRTSGIIFNDYPAIP